MEQDNSASEGGVLDNQIASLRAQAESLRKTLKVESSTILSATATHSLLKSSAIRRKAPDHARLLDHAEQQRAHNQQCLYRICSPVTAFKVSDPDPNAVDRGNVLGLRFEAMAKGQFLRPYYVMLNRPYLGSAHLRVHRHTLPPAIPTAGLAARHLPPPGSGADDAPAEPQDLDRFVRALRREIARYHNRLGVSADLRRSLGVQGKAEADDLTANDIIDVRIADIQAKQISFTWADDRSARVVMNDDGKVLKLVVVGQEDRDWETTKELYGKFDRVEDVAKKLQEYAGQG